VSHCTRPFVQIYYFLFNVFNGIIF